MKANGKKQPVILGDLTVNRPPPPSWQATPGAYLAGRAYADEADLTACEMDRKWGVGRLRLVVGPELREKFDRQRFLYNTALTTGDLEAVKREAQRMVKAWLALDREAERMGAARQSVEVWEVALEDGSVAAIVRADQRSIVEPMPDGRKVAVYTIDEIGRLLSNFPAIVKAKNIFPGATVVAARKRSDPLEAISDTPGGLDDEIPF